MRKLLRFSWAVIGVCLALTVFFGIQLKDIRIENTSRTFMPKDDDSYKVMLQTEEAFGSMLMLGISLETEGETILTPEYIAIIDEITTKVEAVDYVENIDSLTNIDFIAGESTEDGEGSLTATPLVDEDVYTGSTEDMRLIKQKIIDWQEMYKRAIVNDNFKATQMMITVTASTEDGEELPSDVQNEILAEIQGICKEALQGSDLEIRYFGDPVMSHDAKDFLMSDLTRLIPFVALIVLLSLYFSFHTWSGTLMPLITVLISTIWSVGLLSLLGYSFTIIGSMIPVCLIACGSAYGIHVMTHYYIGLDKIEGEVTKEKHIEAILFGVKDVWIAVILAAITTVAGFISNVTSPLRPLRSFSIFSAAGVAFALILSITLIPALLYITPIKSVGKHRKKKNRISTKIRLRIEREFARRRNRTAAEANADTLYNIYSFFAGTKPRLTVFMIAILVLSGIGIKRLVVDTAMVNYFPPDSKFRQDLAYVDETLAGSNSMYIVVRGREVAPGTESVSDSGSAGTVFGDFDFSGMDDSASGSGDAESDFDFSGMSTEADASGFDFDFGGAEGGDFVAERHSMTNPEILKVVDEMQEYLLAHHPEIGKIISYTTFIKRMNQVMHVPVLNAADNGFDDPNDAYAETLASTITVQEALQMLHDAYTAAGGETATVEKIVAELEKSLNFNGIDYYEIPYDTAKYPVATRGELSNLIVQYLYLLSSDQIQRFSDNMTNPSAIRVQVQLKTHSTVDTGLLVKDINAYAEKHFPPEYEIMVTGSAQLEHRMSGLVINSQMVSIAFSLLMVFIIISLSFRSGWAGLIGAIPLGLVILLNFMVMGFAGIRLDLCTSIVSSIAIGVGIDYTIHFMETYQNQRRQLSHGGTTDLEEVTKRTFNTSGRGIITNALAVGLGFLVLVFSKFIILRYIGILVAVVMFTSSALAMSIIPGLINAFDPKFMWTKEEREAYKEKLQSEKAGNAR